MGQYTEVIADLERRRAKIDTAIEALRELDGLKPGDVVVATHVPLDRGPRKVKAKRVSGGDRPSGGVRDNVLELLREAPRPSGAIIACLNVGGNGPSAQQVYSALNFLKAEGKVRRANDGAWSVVK